MTGSGPTLNLDGRLCHLDLHGLELSDGFPKLLAVVRVLDGLVEHAAGESEHLRGDPDAPFVQNLNGNLVALAHLADDVGGGDAEVVKVERAGG